uniref:Lethal protein 754 n=1 Tax=Plectus sambesii TaxID=2011161 RepID=A0A914XA55_9BILA
MGPAGSGKGTVATRILDHFDMRHLSCGDFIRAHIRDNTDMGRQARQFTQKGELVPDDLIAKIMTEEIKKRHNQNWLLDGFPRTEKQAALLDSLDPPDSVIDLDVPFSVIVDRLTKRWIHAPSGRVYNLDFSPPKQPGLDDVTGELLTQREDDKPEVIKQRLQGYHAWESKLADYYRSVI